MGRRTESPPTEAHAYVGQELELFAHAENWKRYWASALLPYVGNDVLEVGAGLGANTRLLLNSQPARIRRWICLEPDPRLLEQLRSLALEQVEPRPGTVANLGADELFDTILYIDVLEHIEDHIGELRRAAEHLRPGGHLVVLSPAHQWLFSEFDAAIGHHRRYTRQSLKAVAESITSLRLEKLWYLDACGLLASAANRLFLRQSSPTLRQILFWDRFLVRCSRVVDPLICHLVGKSVLGIWRSAELCSAVSRVS